MLAGGVTTGAILLNSGVLLSEQAFTGSLQGGVGPATTDAPGGFVLDANTRLLLNIALGLLGVGAAVIGMQYNPSHRMWDRLSLEENVQALQMSASCIVLCAQHAVLV